MTSLVAKTAVVMVASGLSRRFGRHDKLLTDLGGQPLIEHAAGAVCGIDAMARIAVCPFNRPAVGDRLSDRFVLAINKKPRDGLGHSIALGVQIAMQFKPEAILICMGDMPFVESWLLEGLILRLGQTESHVVHAGTAGRPHPPSIFNQRCFRALAELSGDEGAKPLLQNSELRVEPFLAPEPLLLDIDTREDLNLARRQLAIRSGYYHQRSLQPPMDAAATTTSGQNASVTRRIG